MSKYLVKYYPVFPCEEMKICNLEVLRTSGKTHKNWRSYIREEFNSFIYAACRHHKFYTLRDAITTHNNNSNYWFIEADNGKDVINKIADLMSAPAGEEQELSNAERFVFIKALTDEFGEKERSINEQEV